MASINAPVSFCLIASIKWRWVFSEDDEEVEEESGTEDWKERLFIRV